MKHSYEYAFGRILLKPLGSEDIEELRVLRNRERQCFLNQNIVDADSQIQWYDSYLKKENDIMFKVVKEDRPEEFIGAVALYDIDTENKVAEFGRIVIDKEKAPEKGIGLETTKAICRFGFDVLGIRKIVAVVLKNNERVLKVYARVGFHICGEKSSDVYKLEVTRETLSE